MDYSSFAMAQAVAILAKHMTPEQRQAAAEELRGGTEVSKMSNIGRDQGAPDEIAVQVYDGKIVNVRPSLSSLKESEVVYVPASQNPNTARLLTDIASGLDEYGS